MKKRRATARRGQSVADRLFAIEQWVRLTNNSNLNQRLLFLEGLLHPFEPYLKALRFISEEKR